MSSIVLFRDTVDHISVGDIWVFKDNLEYLSIAADSRISVGSKERNTGTFR